MDFLFSIIDDTRDEKTSTGFCKVVELVADIMKKAVSQRQSEIPAAAKWTRSERRLVHANTNEMVLLAENDRRRKSCCKITG